MELTQMSALKWTQLNKRIEKIAPQALPAGLFLTKNANKYKLEIMSTKITKLPKNEIEIEGELDAELFEAYFKEALRKLGENIKLDGFRPGKVPDNVLISKIPEIRILEEMAEMALGEHYPRIIVDEKIYCKRFIGN